MSPLSGAPPHRTPMLLPQFTSRRHLTCLLSLCPAFHSVKGASVCSVSCHRRGSCHGRGVAVAPRPPASAASLRDRGLHVPRATRRVDSRGTCVFLCCAGGRVKTWKRRWFILTDNCLYYFEYTTVSACGGVGVGRPPCLGPLTGRGGGAVGTQSDCLLSSVVGVGGQLTGSGRSKKNPRPRALRCTASPQEPRPRAGIWVRGGGQGAGARAGGRSRGPSSRRWERGLERAGSWPAARLQGRARDPVGGVIVTWGAQVWAGGGRNAKALDPDETAKG